MNRERTEMSEENNNELQPFRITELITVEFFVEAKDYAKAKDVYNKMFDKNIQIGYDTWKDLSNKDIKGGKFHVRTYNKGEEATLIDELWGSYKGEEE